MSKKKIIGTKGIGMKLTGNRITSALFIMCCLANSNADEPTVELTTFTAGTPAKASEVNGNFEVIKDYIDELKLEIKSLKSRTEILEPKEVSYDVPVYGDGALIGYMRDTDRLSSTSDLNILTDEGLFSLDVYEEGNIVFSKIGTKPGGTLGVAFLDATCSGTPYLSDVILRGSSFSYKTNYKYPNDVIFKSLNGSYYKLSKGTSYNIHNGTMYLINNGYIDPNSPIGSCTKFENISSFIFELTPINYDETSQNRSYNSISIEGHQLLK